MGDRALQQMGRSSFRLVRMEMLRRGQLFREVQIPGVAGSMGLQEKTKVWRSEFGEALVDNGLDMPDDGQLDREDPSELAGHSKPTQTRRSVGAKANKKRKSNPSSSKATEQTKPKRSRPAKESIASGRRSSGGVGEMTTRSGRTVKVSEKAKSG
jgi:hypothetical protein